MSAAKETVLRYMAAYDRHDVDEVMATLADDVEWVVPGAFQLQGKDAFAREMANPNFAGKPDITVTRLVAEGDVMVAEGRVRTARADGEPLHLVFCDVFELRDGVIGRLTSYLMPVPSPDATA